MADPTPITNPAPIAAQVLTDVVGRLADPGIGFNAQLAATIAANTRYTANAAFLFGYELIFPPNFVGFSPNVMLAPMPIDDWVATSPTSKNALLMQIYVISAPNDMSTKGLLFDGTVNIGIDCHITWPNSKALYDFDAPISAVEDTVVNIFNSLSSIAYQVWSPGVIWNGRISIPARSAIRKAGGGWGQFTTMSLSFGLQKIQ